ncbi:hypothetical protein QQF64_001621 [Cirrhinus molitorella]|uniref:Uncharacterized protein n=1 Tax=Cirrhinus molitorella TaxID=172907 RepID=A0ABR3P1I2_9TELE
MRCYQGPGKCQGGVWYLCGGWLDFSRKWTEFPLPLGVRADTEQQHQGPLSPYISLTEGPLSETRSYPTVVSAT